MPIKKAIWGRSYKKEKRKKRSVFMERNYVIHSIGQKFPVVLLAHITGLTESTFTAAASSKGWSTKNGLSLEQASEIIKMPRKPSKASNWTKEQGMDAIKGLKAYGIEIKNETILNEFFGGSEKEGYLL